jgi:hypothetical protein
MLPPLGSTWDTVALPIAHTDLAGAEATPYNYEPTAGALSGPSSPTFSGDSSMRQYRDSQALLGGIGGATATSGSHYAPTSSDDASAPLDRRVTCAAPPSAALDSVQASQQHSRIARSRPRSVR